MFTIGNICDFSLIVYLLDMVEFYVTFMSKILPLVDANYEKLEGTVFPVDC